MKNKNNKKMILDNKAWAELYTKFCSKLVNGLNSHYCFADREDAVEFAFDKLMHRKDAAAYGEKYPQSEKDWFWHLHWQARSFLAHLRIVPNAMRSILNFFPKSLKAPLCPDSRALSLIPRFVRLP